MYYFGSKEAFLRLQVPANEPTPWRTTLVVPAASSATPPPAAPPHSTPVAPPPPAMSPAQADRFDLSGFPPQPTTFEEQQVLAAIQAAGTSGLKAFAHRKLAQYYAHKGDAARAQEEAAKADFWNRQP
jgi:hypothetical protein